MSSPRGYDVAVTGGVCTQQSWLGELRPFRLLQSSPRLSPPLSFANCYSFESPFMLSMYSRLVTDFPLEQVARKRGLGQKTCSRFSCVRLISGFPAMDPPRPLPLSNSCKGLKI